MRTLSKPSSPSPSPPRSRSPRRKRLPRRPPPDAKPAAAKAGKAAATTTDKKKEPFSAETFAGLELRDIGPAVTSGRIGDLAVDPVRKGTYYVAVASGGVWKTTNWGTTFSPVFDSEGSFSIGCVDARPDEHPRRLGRDGREQQPAERRATATASTARPTAGRRGRTSA